MRFLFIILSFSGVVSFSLAQGQGTKKMIQFGWDYPTVSFLKANLKKMQKQPFDGVAFTFDFKIFDLFDTTLYPEKKFQFDDLPDLKWTSFTDNFIRVRAQSKDGPNWTNDRVWEKIVANIRNISKALEISGAKGVFFDPEYYYQTQLPDKDPWIYNDTLYPNMSYDEVGRYVRKRGKQLIEALQYHKKDPKILSFYLLSLVTLQARQKPLEQTGMALYPFFVQGMFAGKNPECEIIDGNELAYGYEYEFQFILSGEQLRDWGSAFMPDSLKAVFRNITVSQPVFYDRLFATFPQYEKNYTLTQKENWLSNNLYLAFKVSDEYVWFYNSRLDWWRKGDKKVAAVIKKTRKRLKEEYSRAARNTSGSSKTIDFINSTVIKKGEFSYNFQNNKPVITVNVHTESADSFFVYKDSRLVFGAKVTKGVFSLPIREFYNGKGNLIFVLQEKSKRLSFAFPN